MGRSLAAPSRDVHLAAQPHGLHLQQRQSTQLHCSHLQQAEAFFSVSIAVMTVLLMYGGNAVE